MRHLSAIPLLSTAMITILMLSMSILIACAGNGADPEPATKNIASPEPPEPISQPETPKDDAALAPEIQADSSRESEASPDLAGETPSDARVEESLPPAGAKTMPVEPANMATPALSREEIKSDAYSAIAEDFVGTFVGGHSSDRPPPITAEDSSGTRSGHRRPPTTTGKHGGRPMLPPTDLKAGEVDDNQRWNEYLQFTKDYDGHPVHRTNLADRRIITVLDRDGNPVPNAIITVSDNGKQLAEYLTYADGRTLIFPEALQSRPASGAGGWWENGQLDISVERDGFTGETILVPQEGDSHTHTHTVTLDGKMTYGMSVPLDVLFLLDSTGSMADEIQQIKTTLQSIAKRVSNLPANPDLRFGMVSYRDRDDTYVTRLHDFDGNVDRFQQTIRGVRASGGNDYPESLNQALHEAVNDASWRENAIRLTFLIADAPPHLDYPQDEDYAVEMVRAREKGIKIFSVASSGLDEQGEYIFRQIAQQTMGNFLFILYQDGPQGKLDTPHSVEQFTVNNLDGLIVRLIEMELAGIEGREQPGMRMK